MYKVDKIEKSGLMQDQATAGWGCNVKILPKPIILKFIKITPENPVLWTGMKGVSAKGRKRVNQMSRRRRDSA